MTGPDTQPPAPGPPGRDRGLRLTAEALQAAVNEDQEQAAQAVRELDQLGTQTLVTAVTAWCDTLINAYRQATGTPDTAPVQPGWVHADSGVVAADADGVPAGARWAGRFIAARAAMDHPACYALLGALPDDPAAAGEHVVTLLNMCGLTLRELHRKRRRS